MWRNVTNLPAGLFTVASSLNEYKITNFHWFEKGGKIGSMSPHPWFLLLNMKYDDRTVKAEIFCLNFLNFMLLWQNL